MMGDEMGNSGDLGMGDMSSLGSLSREMPANHILAAKISRKKAEQDVMLLKNRIDRLRQEEKKAKQKVHETKLRGQEIVTLKKRNEQANAAKSLAKQIQFDQQEREVQQQAIKKAEQRAALKATFEAMHCAKREDVRAQRKARNDNEEAVRENRDFEVTRARKGKDAIRNHQKAVHGRFEKQREAHQEFLAQDFINMITMEDSRRDEIERDIAQMEIEERKHIERLRALQEEQKSAYDQLESALAG